MNNKQQIEVVEVMAMRRIITILICLLLFLVAGCDRSLREFSMDGHNVSSMNSKLIIEKIREFEKLDDQTPIFATAYNPDLMLTSDFDWAHDGAIDFFYQKEQSIYSAQIRFFNEENKYYITESTKIDKREWILNLEHYIDALKYMPQEEIRRLSPGADKYLLLQVETGNPKDYEKSVIYSPSGIKDSNGWLIHISIQSLYKVDDAYRGSGNDIIHLFYRDE